MLVQNVGGAGFEPTKSKTADLQSAPVGHFGIPPALCQSSLVEKLKKRAGGRIRTADPLITNQLLWPTELHRLLFFQDDCSSNQEQAFHQKVRKNTKGFKKKQVVLKKKSVSSNFIFVSSDLAAQRLYGLIRRLLKNPT